MLENRIGFEWKTKIVGKLKLILPTLAKTNAGFFGCGEVHGGACRGQIFGVFLNPTKL